MNPRIEKLTTLLASLQSQIKTIQEAGESGDRALTAEEISKVKELQAKFENSREEIATLRTTQEQDNILATSLGRQSEPTQLAVVNSNHAPRQTQSTELATHSVPRAIAGMLPAELKSGSFGYFSLGHFAMDVRNACVDNGRMSQQLSACQQALAIFVNEGTGSEGGFAVPPDFRKEIMTRMFGDDSLASYCDDNPTSSNSLKVPKDETLPWDAAAGNGGVRAYWINGDGAQIANSKPILQDWEIKLNKLAALVHVTDEMLEDVSSINAHIRRKAPEAMRYVLNEALLFGTGVGTPNGCLNGTPGTTSSRVRVTKETGQTAATIVFGNISKMRNRMLPNCRKNAAWLYNADIEPELEKMFVPTGTTGNTVFMPAGGISTDGYNRLYGRPMIPIENCRALGSEGDIIFVDLKQYALLTKQGGVIRQDTTISMFFDQDIQSFRFIMRVGGAPWWNKPWSRPNGATRSWCVTVEDRA